LEKTRPPTIGGGHAEIINGVTSVDLARYPFEALEAQQHGDKVMWFCGIIHSSAIPPLGLIQKRMCSAARCAADFWI
jgi:hypothetical protein